MCCVSAQDIQIKGIRIYIEGRGTSHFVSTGKLGADAMNKAFYIVRRKMSYFCPAINVECSYDVIGLVLMRCTAELCQMIIDDYEP